MARKLHKKAGREIYARHKTTVEPAFCQIKEARGLRRFLLRGLEKVNGEWLLWGTTHNLNKLPDQQEDSAERRSRSGHAGQPTAAIRSR